MAPLVGLDLHFLLAISKQKIKVSPGPYPASKDPPEPCIQMGSSPTVGR